MQGGGIGEWEWKRFNKFYNRIKYFLGYHIKKKKI